MTSDKQRMAPWGQLPKMSIDPRLWCSGSESVNEALFDFNPLKRLEVGFSTALKVAQDLEPILEYIEVIRIRYRLYHTDPSVVVIRCEATIVEPHTRHKMVVEGQMSATPSRLDQRADTFDLDRQVSDLTNLVKNLAEHALDAREREMVHVSHDIRRLYNAFDDTRKAATLRKSA